jgi:hypothetical protein
LVTTVTAHAQRSAFRSGYLRFGFNTLGEDLDVTQSPKENIFAGKFGADRGYVLEMGRIFYFQDKRLASLLNIGIDWTYFTLNYNELNQWDDYGAANATDYYTGGEKIAAAISTKIGPVVSLNLIEKVVIDARLQLAPTFRFFDHSYYENEGLPNERSFSFTNDLAGGDDENYDAESLKNRVGFGLQTNVGLTLRRKAIGIAIDYQTGKFKSNYQAIENGAATFGKDKMKANSFQLKLSITL